MSISDKVPEAIVGVIPCKLMPIPPSKCRIVACQHCRRDCWISEITLLAVGALSPTYSCIDCLSVADVELATASMLPPTDSAVNHAKRLGIVGPNDGAAEVQAKQIANFKKYKREQKRKK